MTDMEKVIVSAYTGYSMTNFGEIHKYIERMLGRPVFTHELADEKVQCAIMAATKEDFLALCEGKFPPSFMGIN